MSEKYTSLSITDLPIRDVLSLVDKQQSRQSKAEMLGLLYCQSPAIAQSILTSLDYRPQQFVSIFSQANENLLANLPEQYDFEFSLKPTDKHQLKVTHIRFKGLIISKDAHTSSLEKHGWLGRHSDYVDAIDDDFYDSSSTTPAGRFGFFLLQECTEDTGFIFLMSTFTALLTPKDLPRLSDEEISRVLPVPLRYSDGSTAQISDRIRELQETLVRQIAEEHDYVGIVQTTPPSSSEGKEMLERQGYHPFVDLHLPQAYMNRLKETETYTITLNDEYYGKIITVPK